MEYRKLGRSGLKVSALGLGTMGFGNRPDASEAARLLDAAIDAGINFIDTADCYGPNSEDILGEAFAASGKRDDIVLATKFSAPVGGINDCGGSRYHIMRACERSLQRLKTDHIDLYQIHLMDLDTPIDETLSALNDLVTQGKVRYIGTSKFASSMLAEMMALTDRHGWAAPLTESCAYNLLDRQAENELIWTCERHGIGLLPFRPIASGILSGKYSKGAIPENSRYTGPNVVVNPAATAVADQLLSIAQEKSVTTAELSLAWVMNQPAVTSALIGPDSIEQLNSSLKAVDVRFDGDDHDRIDAIIPPGTYVSPFFSHSVRRSRSLAA